METFQVLRQEANKAYRMADHLLNVTYPLIKDTKLLVSVTENIFLTLDKAMSSILHHERLFKLVPPFSDNFENKFQTFHQKCVRKFNIDQEYLDLMMDLREILQLHKTSPVEFRHKDRFIICTNNYQMKAITYDQLRMNLKKTYKFIDMMDEITSRNERFFK